MPPNDLVFYIPSKDGLADGFTLASRTVDGGSTTLQIIDAGITEADNFWNDALIRFDDATTTVALRGKYARVQTWTQGPATLDLFRALPATPVAGDTFVIFTGGRFRSDLEAEELDATGLVNVTGVTIDRAMFRNGEGSGTLSYINGTTSLTWQAPGSASAGDPVDVSLDGTYLIQDGDDVNAALEVTVVAVSLPGSDQNDTITLAFIKESMGVPTIEGSETAAGVTRYFPIVARNDSGGPLTDVRAWMVEDPEPGTTLQIGAGTVGGGSEFENPGDINTAPGGVSFSNTHISFVTALTFGSVAAGDFVVVWVEETTAAGASPVACLEDTIRFSFS